MEYDPSNNSVALYIKSCMRPSWNINILKSRGAGGRHVTGNGRTVVDALPYPIVQNDMETQIHLLEQEAYTSVLRAFKVRSDAITWEKESLITELRKELRISDDEHRKLLNMVNADDIIRRIREWRQAGVQSGLLNNHSQPAHDLGPSPSASASRKRKTSQLIPSLSLGAPLPALHSQPVATSMQPSLSAAKRGAAPGTKSKQLKSSLPGASSIKSLQHPLTSESGRAPATNRSSSGALAATEPAETVPYDHLIGQKVMTRWPEDNNFYEAVITDYNSTEGLHLLVYDINTNNETWEWVNLKEISSEDIRWEGEDPGISHRLLGQDAAGGGAKGPTGGGSTIPGAGGGRGSLKSQSKKAFRPSQNGRGRKSSGEIEILHSDTLIKVVERILNARQPDPLVMDKAKKALRDQEQALIDAIARLANASDGENDDEHQFSHRDQGYRYQQYSRNDHGANNYDDIMIGENREAFNGGHIF